MTDIISAPLAERVRPRDFSSFRGQESLTAPGKPLRSMIDSDSLSSFILWGPPGTGKTTIARIISENTKSFFFKLNAVSSGVKDVRDLIEQARKNLLQNKRTILFIDEIHRFNKAQQDALLAPVESGDIILIGATTENPSFEVIPALRSRVRIFCLEPLGAEDLGAILDEALQKDQVMRNLPIKEIDRDFLFYLSGGDARGMLSILEAAVMQQKGHKEIILTKEAFESIVQRKNYAFDKLGEEHYNIISAFIKSIRGSDPDAALYWMARMIEGGEDPLFIARRLVVAASEDIGNASPNALLIANAAFEAVQKIGMPEGRIPLAQAVTYLASAPKSNRAYLAIGEALSDVRKKPLYPVPLHLRNAPTELLKSLKYGRDYKYPHDYPNDFIELNYFPEEMSGRQYYSPSGNGLESGIKDRMKFLWKRLKKY